MPPSHTRSSIAPRKRRTACPSRTPCSTTASRLQPILRPDRKELSSLRTLASAFCASPLSSSRFSCGQRPGQLASFRKAHRRHSIFCLMSLSLPPKDNAQSGPIRLTEIKIYLSLTRKVSLFLHQPQAHSTIMLHLLFVLQSCANGFITDPTACSPQALLTSLPAKSSVQWASCPLALLSAWKASIAHACLISAPCP